MSKSSYCFQTSKGVGSSSDTILPNCFLLDTSSNMFCHNLKCDIMLTSLLPSLPPTVLPTSIDTSFIFIYSIFFYKSSLSELSLKPLKVSYLHITFNEVLIRQQNLSSHLVRFFWSEYYYYFDQSSHLVRYIWVKCLSIRPIVV